MTNDGNRLDRLLNTRLYDPPESSAEVEERLSASTHRHDPADQQLLDVPSPPAGVADPAVEAPQAPKTPRAAEIPIAAPDFSQVAQMQELVTEIRALGATFQGAMDESATFSATDTTGTIRATVDGTGRLSELIIRRQWKESLGVDGFEVAVLEALSTAAQERLKSWIANAQQPQPGSSDSAPDLIRLSEGRPSELDRTTMLQLAEQLFAEFDERFTAAEEDLRKNRAMRQQVDDDGEPVRATVTGGVVTGLSIDREWLENAPSALLIAEIKSAVHAASAAPEPPASQSLTSTTNAITELVQQMMSSSR